MGLGLKWQTQFLDSKTGLGLKHDLDSSLDLSWIHSRGSLGFSWSCFFDSRSVILISEGPAKGLSIFCSFKNYNNPLPVNSTNMNINLGRSNQNVFALQTNQLTTTSSQYLPQQQLQPPYPLLATNSSPALISPPRMSFVSFPPISSIHHMHPPASHINLTVNGRQQPHSQPTVTLNHVVFLLIFGVSGLLFNSKLGPRDFS